MGALEWLVPVGVLYGLHRLGFLELDFPIRQRIHWRRGAPPLPHASKAGLFEADAAPEAERLVQAYQLQDWERVSGRGAFEASLFYLQMLERAFTAADVALPERLTAVDVGPSDWFYVQTLHAFLTRWRAPSLRTVQLDGVELDAWRLYQDLRSRADWAEAYIGPLEGVRYLAQDVRHYQQKVQVACMFFPFLFQDDVRRWGLPRRYLQPAALLQHVVSLVQPGGVLFIVNQGEAERDAQHALLAAAGLEIAWSARHVSPLATFEPERYITLVRP